MSRRDDPYQRDDPYRDGPDDDLTRPQAPDDARPGRRHATRPARPAWDAMTYGRPDDARRPTHAAEPEPAPYRSWSGAEPSYGSPSGSEPSYGSWSGAEQSYGSPSGSEPSYGSQSYEQEPDWASRYGPAPSGPAPPQPPPPPPPPPPSYPAATPYPASAYPAAADYSPPALSETFAPDSYTSYRATPASLSDEAEPVYVAAGLYLDEPSNGSEPAPATAGEWTPAGDASAYPGGLDEQPAPPPSKGGRNLPAAIGVGVGLGVVVLSSLFLWRPAFLGVVAVAVVVGVWELVRALRRTGANPPLVPLLVGGALMTALAWWGAVDGVTFGLMITVVAVMVWRFAHGPDGYSPDVTMAALVAVYVPFLGGFAAMLARPEDGDLRVLATLIAVVLCDTGGYAVGARFGQHPMAPSVSPKKSWEGLGGSVVAAALGSGVVLMLMFGVAFWWGLLFGLAVALASIVGDLGESMVKRAIGVKDMSGLLPGHGGVMDRLDSVLFAAPVGYVLLSVIAPVTG